MEFDINRIPSSGFVFKFSANSEQFGINQSDCVIQNPVIINGELKLLKKEIYLKGEAKADLVLICSRCLSSFQFRAETEVFARFITKPLVNEYEMERKMLEEEIYTEFYSDSKINIAQSVRDSIMLALPMIQLCDNDCRGLCSYCGQNFNKSICQCGEDIAIDPRLEKLKQLKDRLKENKKENN